ncbi:MAG: SLC26A/SulP transporter family protein [Ardenticatenaceae bacterium]|nr:SLC26A/SulP transporter family protein [Ardenticatenaceae bacterium]
MNQTANDLKGIPLFLLNLRQEFEPNRLIPNITAGVIVGLLQIVRSISYAALVFTGDLSAFVANGIGLVLLATIILGLMITLFTSLPGALGNSQDIPSAILAGIVVTISQSIAGSAPPQEVFLTNIAAISTATLATGIFLWILGQFKLGSLVRFFPYPVVGGFLAGTGWLITKGAFSMMANQPLSIAFLQQDMLLRWVPGLVFALALFLILRYANHSLIIPGMVIGGTLLFYLVAFLSGSAANLSAQGWVLGPFPQGGLWHPISLASLDKVHWSAIGNQAINLTTIPIMSAMALLLNGTGLELATQRDMNLNHELKITGIANIFVGLTGGVAGYHSLGSSSINYKLGVNGRLAGLITTLICLIALLFGASALSLFPKVVLGGLLLYLGLSFLKDWVYHAWFRLPKLDYFVVILILLVTAFVGFLEAVGVGLVTAVILFVINYSRIDIVRHELSGTTLHSRVTRPPRQQQLLDQHGDHLYILRLQGFIFFGTADNLLNTIRSRINHSDLSAPRYIILDFRRVTAIDSTASLSFSKLKQLAEAKDIILVLAEMSPTIQQQLQKGDFGASSHIHIAPDLDRALEWCEQQLLQTFDTTPNTTQELGQRLQMLLTNNGKVKELVNYLERQEVPPGHYLIKQGDAPDALYFIESGQVTAQLERPNQEPIRLQTMRGGHVVGEIGFYLGQQRSAAVVADEPSIVYRLSLDTLKQMEANDSDIASTLHQLIVHRLAERVNHLVTAVNALQN